MNLVVVLVGFRQGIAMTVNDTVDQSMIADGSCRMTTPVPTDLDGYALWHFYEGRAM